MGYTYQSFQDNMVLRAQHLINIENAIIGLDNQLDLPEYDASSTYIVGDIVIYNDNVYECSTKISTAEAWNASHWTQKSSPGLIETRMKQKIALMDSGDTVTTNQFVTAVNVVDGKLSITKGTASGSSFSGATSLADGTAGLVPAPEAGDENKYLKGNGTWATVSVASFGGATASNNGTAGAVPAPSSGDENKYLKGDGTWGSVTTSTFDGQSAGLVPAPSSGDTNKFLKSDGTWDTVSSGTLCTSTTVTLLSNGWTNNSQTVSNVSGVTDSNSIIVSPDPTYRDVYLGAQIVCTTQGSGTLTFVADTTPSTDVVVNVLIFG